MIKMVGGASAFIGFWIAYQWDCPIGPTDVVLVGIISAFVFALKKTRVRCGAVKAEFAGGGRDFGK